MVVIANLSRTRTFIYAILVLLLINLAVLAYLYFRYLGDFARPEIATVEESSLFDRLHPNFVAKEQRNSVAKNKN